jgi:AraC family transcriptional regulator
MALRWTTCAGKTGLKAFSGPLEPRSRGRPCCRLRAVRDGVPDLYAESAAHFLARHLLARHAIDAGRTTQNTEGARLGRVEDYLRSHISDPVSLGDLAIVADCSTFQLIRFCKSHWEETPFAPDAPPDGTRARTAAHSDASIITISFECGYGNPAHFATAFRRSVGMSPSHYRAG